MSRVTFSVVRYLRNKTAGIYSQHPTLVRSGAFITTSAVCGLLIANFHLVPVFTEKDLAPSVTVAAQPKSKAPVSRVTQTDPQFAGSPSWSQDFTSQKSKLLDSQYWNVLVGPAENSNNEQQYYTDSPANLRIENDALRLIATRQAEPAGYKYGSARIETQNKQSFKYGRMDITAKLPSGSGSWPAVWLLPANNMYADKSPASNELRYKNGGEIDVLEAVGFQPDVVYGVAHTASDLTNRADGTGVHGTINVPGSTTSFNKYTLLWTPTSLTFAINDQSYYTYNRQNGADYTTWPFDQPFYLIANLAMGGSWGGMDTAHYPGNGIDNSALPSSMDIRSIYYYPYVGSKDVK